MRASLEWRAERFAELGGGGSARPLPAHPFSLPHSQRDGSRYYQSRKQSFQGNPVPKAAAELPPRSQS
jgi:hypothetical protein